MSRTPETEQEQRLLFALATMAAQYLQAEGGGLDHLCMSAGEGAMEVLFEYGLVSDCTRHGRWTESGARLLDSR